MDISTKQIKSIVESTDAAYYSQLQRDAVRLDFAPSAQTLKTLHTLYFPRLFSPGRGQPTAHQLAAAHQRYAERMLHQYAKRHKPCIEIGPNPTGMMKIGANDPKVHGCCLYTGRDQARYTTAAASVTVRGCRDRTYTNQVNLLASGIPTEKFCIAGFGACDFQAPFAISNHSLYDITLQEVAAGMLNHNLSKIVAYMHLPPAALKCDFYNDNEFQIRHKVFYKGDNKRILMGFPNDPGWAYDHDFNTVMAYLTHSGLETPYGFNLMLERVVNFGSHFCIHITRTALPVTIYASIPAAFVNAIGVPDFFHLASEAYKVGTKPKMIITDKIKVERLYYYLLARDAKQADLRAAFAYARAELRKVTLGDQIIDHQWDIDCEDFNRIVVGVYLMARLTAAKNNATVDSAAKQMDKLKQKRRWLERFFPAAYDVISSLQCALKSLFGDKYEVSRLLSDKGNNPLLSVSFERFESEFTEYEFNAEGAVDEVKFDLLEHYDETPIGPLPKTINPTPEIAEVREAEAMPTIDNQELYDKFVQELSEGLIKAESMQMQTVLRAALRATKDTGPVPFDPTKFTGVFGVPGGCKTAQAFLKHIPNMVKPGENFLYIVPTNALKEGLESRVQPPNRISTMHAAMHLLASKRITPSLILVDEAFRLPLPMLAFYSKFAHVLLIGDPNQIAHIDRESIWRDSPQLKQIYRSIKHEFLLQSSRIPLDICKLPLIATMYPGITTTSKKGTDSEGPCGPSLSYTHANFVREGAQVLTLTQETKARYINQGAITVDEAQGGTFSTVILHVGDTPAEKWLLQNSVAHIVVGLTRHTNLLFVREETPGALNNAMKVHMGGHVELDILTDPTNIPEPEFGNPKQPAYSVTQLVKDGVGYVTSEINAGLVDEVLAQIYPGTTDIHEYQSVESTYFPFHHGGSAQIRIDEIHNDAQHDVAPQTVHRFDAAQRVKVTNAKGTGMALRTLLDRYTKKTKNLPELSATHEAHKLHMILKEYINFNISATDKAEVFAEALEKYQLRGHDVTQLKDIDCWTDQGVNLVKFNTKTQQKVMVSKDPLTTDKAGQGIAAWDKSLNFIMVVWTRLLERVALRASNGLIFASNRTDTEMLQLLDCISQEAEYEYLESDWTEFDSSQNNLEHQLLMCNLAALGCPAELRNNFLQMMKVRNVQSRVGTVRVQNKKDSGRVDTLIGNSLFNAAILLSCVDRQDIKYLLYKGDDSLIVATRIRPNYIRLAELDRNCGFRLKMTVAKSAEFTSFVINSNGAALNIPRIAAKVLTRNYTKEKYPEYVIAVADLIKSSNNVEVAQRMCQVNSIHFRTTSERIDACLSFLHNFGRGRYPFDKLTIFDARTKIEGM